MHKKIKSRAVLKNILNKLRNKNKLIVFTNGCFDIIHPGHIAYLKKARQKGDILVVGLNSDSSVRKLKGKGRPLIHERQRAEHLASLEFVDFVTIFNESTPIKAIEALRPHVLVKGGDWQKTNIVGRDFVESCGGKVVRIAYLKGHSTTGLIKKICKNLGC